MLNNSDGTAPLSTPPPIPRAAPGLSVGGTAISHYTLNWQTDVAHELIDGSGTLPSTTVTLGQELWAEISAPERPLSLTLMVFEGSLASLDPTAKPVSTFDCLDASSPCTLAATAESTTLRLAAHDIPREAVVSIFAEYWRDPRLASAEGPTNLVGWAFGAHRPE